MSSTRISVDPVTRIEGHLRIDCDIQDGKVVNAWSSGQMWRGIETILTGRDPRDAWLYTQRICGVCTTVHAIASVRAVEDALNLEIPLNAQLIRNLIIAAHGIHDHVVHFYHLSALDWVDVVSALQADPQATATLAQSLSDWPNNNARHFAEVQARVKRFVESGQLGIFAHGYWGHPAMKLPPEANLMAVAHYLEAMDYQRKSNQITAILGSKTPHIQNLAVGGVANAINPDDQSTLNLERLAYVRTLIDELGAFVRQVYLPDVIAIAALYADWLPYGAGVTNYLSVPDFPRDTKGTDFAMPGGYIPAGDLARFQSVEHFGDPFFEQHVKESIKHSWYQGDWTRSPYQGETVPDYTDFQEDAAYSWVKSPTFLDEPAQVGPLANVLAMVAAGHQGTIGYLNDAIARIGAIAGTEVPMSALHSSLGRHLARCIRTQVLYDQLVENYEALVGNIARGDYTSFNAPVFPKGEQMGFGFHEAPRGVLSHWIVIENGKIKNYQAVVPSTWNAGPRNQNDALGPYEASLLDNPILEEERPLEVLRTVHSFDPCLACAVHLHDNERRDIVRVRAL
ncbi:nickel-dependent hydrogenase large subunit [Allochromatium palmeri]|uniref:hydrogenase (acceptor) n=1 Tax=Allochromatium palmeri TaxID=231048 RepID=A0A6N8EEZ0_9GAMM|nr:nickel-dependent hydrogenase large subunit [Allochromatium palmeri]MTW20904.1 hydrogenase 2 large subunit [Allochromatium palmeri]